MSSDPQVAGALAVTLVHANCQSVGKRGSMRGRGGQKSIATPGVTASVIASKSEGSHFLSGAFTKCPYRFLLEFMFVVFVLFFNKITDL